jgi:hypothetical protein
MVMAGSKPSTTWRRGSRIVVALAALAAPLGAHDFWIEPSTFEAAPGTAVALDLRVGEHFVGDPVPRSPERIVRFDATGPGAVVPADGSPGDAPAGIVRLPGPGVWIAAYRSNHAFVELEATQFEDYLRMEGLDLALAERARRGESGAKSRELYSRCAKTLLRVGDGGGADRALGLTLELVAEGDPAALGPGAKLPIRLLYQGRALAGALVMAVPRSDPTKVRSARSDRDGRVRFALDAEGPWLVKAVHMVRWQQDERADWESLWASLTFAVSARSAPSENRHETR